MNKNKQKLIKLKKLEETDLWEDNLRLKRKPKFILQFTKADTIKQLMI